MLLCAHIVHLNSSGVPESSQSRGGLSACQKRVTIVVLVKNGYENTNFSTLSGQCHLSVRHFSGSFRTSFGIPVHQWLVKQPVKRAKDLRHTNFVADRPQIETFHGNELPLLN